MRARKLVSIPLSLALVSGLYHSKAFAWGERGHDGVTRVATRLVAESEDPETQKFGLFLQRKENMLGHLANVPDIVWRSLGKEVDAISAPSHFIELEVMLPPGNPPKAEAMPTDIKSMLAVMAKNCSRAAKVPCVEGDNDTERLKNSGHSPFRIQTLMEDLRDTFKEIKALELSLAKEPKAEGKDKDDPRTALTQKAILYAGVLSHFVGDLANPHHTAADYDGWNTDQGGLHGYFESEIVDSYPLDLEQTVFDEANRHEPMKEIFGKYKGNYLREAWALALESNSHLDELVGLDKKYSLLEKSVKGDRETRKRAKRKDVKDTRSQYRNFTVLRLAVGADALARLWTEAWVDGGKPDLSFYRSYHYDVKPDLIPLRYLPSVKETTK